MAAKSEYWALIEKIQDEFGEDEFAKLKTGAKGAGLPNGLLSKCKETRDILTLMTRKGKKLKEGDFGKLKEFLESIELYVMVEDHFENTNMELTSGGAVGGSLHRDATPVNAEQEGGSQTSLKNYDTDDDDEPEDYTIKEGEKGYFILVDNFTKERKGSDKDCLALRQFFVQQLGYEHCYKSDLSKDNLMRFFEEQRNTLMNGESKYDKLVVVIMSHGQKEGIKTCNENGTEEFHIIKGKKTACVVTFDDIIQKLKGTLLGKPKLFFFQACLGTKRQLGRMCSDDRPDDDMDVDEVFDQGPALLLPEDADILSCFATTPGYFAYRRTGNGSWFIQTLMRVLNKYHKKRDLLSMLTIVNKKMAEKKGEMSEKQMSSFLSTLRFKAWLRI